MPIPKITAPVIVADLPADAGRNMMQMPDGELRIYGHRITRTGVSPEEAVPVVMKSRDGGASWTTEEITAPCPGAMSRSPWSGRYLTIIRATGRSPSG